jgi:3-mercaptopyruvate sulfurtransferase SseA
MLMDRGFKKVRPLAGGLEAWIAAGYDVEEERFEISFSA